MACGARHRRARRDRHAGPRVPAPFGRSDAGRGGGRREQPFRRTCPRTGPRAAADGGARAGRPGLAGRALCLYGAVAQTGEEHGLKRLQLLGKRRLSAAAWAADSRRLPHREEQGVAHGGVFLFAESVSHGRQGVRAGPADLAERGAAPPRLDVGGGELCGPKPSAFLPRNFSCACSAGTVQRTTSTQRVRCRAMGTSRMC